MDKWNLIILKSFCIASLVQLLSHILLFTTPWTSACQASLSFTISQSLLKLMSIELVMPSNHLTFCHPLLLPPSIFPSIRVFSSDMVLHSRWPKYWSFTFSISPSYEYLGLISFRIDWFDLLAVQGSGLVAKSCLTLFLGQEDPLEKERDSQESSPIPQLESINSSALSFIYSPTITSIHDY